MPRCHQIVFLRNTRPDELSGLRLRVSGIPVIRIHRAFPAVVCPIIDQVLLPHGHLQEIGNLLPNNRRQRRTCYALCHLLYPVSAAQTSIFRMESNSTSYGHLQRVWRDLIAASVFEQHNFGGFRSNLQRKLLHNCSGT